MPLTDSDISAVMAADMTPRRCRLKEASGYVDGTVYDGRPDFFDDSVPLRERRPCVIYPVVRNAVASYTSMCLGDGKFPRITSGASEDDSVIDERFGLDEKSSVIVDAGIRKIMMQARLPAVAQQVFETELHAGTSVTVVSVVKGKLRVSQLDPSVCTPTFAADDPDTVTSLEIKYRYVTDDTWSTSERRFVRRVFVYRRVIDDQLDTTFAPVEITSATADPVPDQPATGGAFKHGFGFCPVVWRRANVAVSDQQGLDGRPIHWGLFSLIDTVNQSLSQRFRAALYMGDPQMVEIGVTDDEINVPMGRASDARQPGVDPSGFNEPLHARRRSGSQSEKRRKRGAGTVWRYESPDADVKVLALPGDALKVIADDIADNVKKLREALGHVYLNAEDLSGFGDISGKTLAFIYAQQIARCDRLREDFGRGWILPVLNMLFRIVLASGTGIYLAGAAKLQAILKRFNATVGAANDAQWFAPELTLTWGAYFMPSDLDEATRIKAVLDALGAERPLITYATAVTAIQSIFPDIQDPAQYVDALLKEGAARQQQAIAKSQAMLFAMGPGDAPDDTTTPDDSTPAPKPAPKRKRPAKLGAGDVDSAAA